MKLRLWPRRRRDEPAGEEPRPEEELGEPAPAPVPPVPADEPPAPAPARPRQPASGFARPYASEEEAAATALPAEPAPVPPPAPAAEPPAPARARPGQPASGFARPYAPEEDPAPALPAEPPAAVSLTIDEAKAAIRAAGGDVIQIGFLARAYLRQQEEEPAGREAAAARKRLCDLVAKRLEDRKLLAPEGRFELLEESPPSA
ncbi:MAG TPA: hypothetical protein VNO56_03095 [Gaiellaceae bacterium]|nr:hypothetical protein [Gaiellaceae bacterium]